MNDKYTAISPINRDHKIFLAKNIQNNKICVKKVMSIFNLEVYKYLKELKPKGVPEIFDYEVYDDELAVYEEYIEGLDLEQQLARGRKFSSEEIRLICASLCEILETINKNETQIVHRDIKPSNIIYNTNGVYLLDFNAAKIIDEEKSRDTVLLGTEGYASPEQYGFGSSSIKSDIYSIGILLKELSSSSNIDDKIITNISKKCTMINPDQRYPNLEELEFDLKHYNKYGSRRILPVGFRSNKPINMIIATIGYLLIIFIFSGLVTSNGNIVAMWMDRIYFMILGFVLIAFLGNYLGWWYKWGFKDTWTLYLKMLWVVSMFILIFLVSTVIFLLLQGITIQIIG